MGLIYFAECPVCGESARLMVGYGMRGSEYMRETICKGKYGSGPIEFLMEHPDSSISAGRFVYTCGCGYIAALPEAVLRDGDSEYRIRHQCPECGKDLQMHDEVPESHRCKCGAEMRISCTGDLWD